MGRELTERLVERLSLTIEQAEQAKFENGLTGPQTDVVRMLNEGIRPLLAEIRSSINYFKSETKAPNSSGSR